MTRGARWCCLCSRPGHVAADCPDRPRAGVLGRLRAWWAGFSNPLDVDTVWQESKPDGHWSELSRPGKLERRP